jgi:hypothetical protein
MFIINFHIRFYEVCLVKRMLNSLTNKELGFKGFIFFIQALIFIRIGKIAD